MAKKSGYLKTKIGKKYGSGVTSDLLEKFKEIEDDTKLKARFVVEKAFKELVDETPVDTGYAASGWYVTGRGEKSFVLPEAKTEQGKVAAAQDPMDIQRLGILKIRQAAKSSKFLEGVRIGNDVPYMPMLENGHSSQNAYFIKKVLARVGREIGGYRSVALQDEK